MSGIVKNQGYILQTQKFSNSWDKETQKKQKDELMVKTAKKKFQVPQSELNRGILEERKFSAENSKSNL